LGTIAVVVDLGVESSSQAVAAQSISIPAADLSKSGEVAWIAASESYSVGRSTLASCSRSWAQYVRRLSRKVTTMCFSLEARGLSKYAPTS
jgi:hypothetical protein